MHDFDLASRTTGSRFVFVKDKLALLERALSNFMINKHIFETIEILPNYVQKNCSRQRFYAATRVPWGFPLRYLEGFRPDAKSIR